MDIVQGKKLKSVFLLAAMHAQTAPVLFVGAIYDWLAGRRVPDAAKFRTDAADMARALNYPPLGEDHPVYHVARSVAQRAGVYLTDVYMDKNYPFYNAGVVADGSYAAIFLRGNPLNHPDINKKILCDIVAHELTHVTRRVVDHQMSYTLSRMLMAGMTLVYGGLAMHGSGIAGLLAGASAFSVLAGIPALERAYFRNEEYLADIGGAELSGNPQRMHDTMGVMQKLAEEPVTHASPDDKKALPFGYSVYNKLFGLTHPTLSQRQDVLRRVFSLSSGGGPGTGSPEKSRQNSVHPPGP